MANDNKDSLGGTGNPRSNLAREVMCLYCGAEDHWKYERLKLFANERKKLVKIRDKMDAKKCDNKSHA